MLINGYSELLKLQIPATGNESTLGCTYCEAVSHHPIDDFPIKDFRGLLFLVSYMSLAAPPQNQCSNARHQTRLC